MKKIEIVWVALFAVLAFSAVVASSAFAEDTQWLWEGNEVTAELAVDTAGELLLEDAGASLKFDILCSGLFGGVVGGLLGTAGPPLGEVNDVEDLVGNLTSATVTKPLDCETETSCAEKLANVTPINLPWKTELLLETHVGVSEFIDDFTSDNGVAGAKPGYTVDCTVLGVLLEDTCTGEPKALLENETGGVLGTFDENEGVNTAGECSLGGAKSGLVIGSGLMTHTGGGTLSVSVAEDTQWLWEGAKIAAELAADTSNELLFEDTKASVKIDILCTVLFGGAVGGLLGIASPLLGEVNDVEDLAGHLTSATQTEPLDCETETSCAEKLANISPIHLPWKTELLLEAHGGVSEFIDDFTSDGNGAPGYTLDCSVLGVLTEDTCTGGPKALLENETGGVLGTFDENEEINPPGSCVLGGEKSGLVIGTGLTVHTSGGTLSISEE